MHIQYTPTQKDIQRFWPKVAITANPDLCWEWQAAKDKRGYGIFGIHNGRPFKAHRFAWIITYGAIPDGLFVCHHCDTPSCVNPNHLFLGTPKDNMHDMIAKKRNKSGEQHPSAKLTSKQVREIRELYKLGGISQMELANLYGLSDQQVSRIVTYKLWKDD